MKNLFLILFFFSFNSCVVIQEIDDFGQYCPNTLDHAVSGEDRDFNGPVNHDITVSFVKDNASKKLTAKIFLKLDEQNSNNENETKVNASWEEEIYVAPENKFISGLKLNGDSHYSFSRSINIKGNTGEAGFEIFCNDGKNHSMKADGFTFNFISDTGSEDVSDDRDCKCDSRINSIKTDRKLHIELVEYLAGSNCKIKNQHFNTFLEADVSTEGIVVRENNNLDTQIWETLVYPDGSMKLRNKHFRKVLELSEAPNHHVQLNKDFINKSTHFPNAGNQKWLMVQEGEYFLLRNAHFKDFILGAITGNDVIVFRTNSRFTPGLEKWKVTDCNSMIQ